VDLLEHEVGVAGLLGGLEVPGDVAADRRDVVAVEGGDPQFARAHLDDLVVVEDVHLTRQREQGGDVGGDQAGAVAAPGDERRPPPGGDDELGVAGVDDRQRERALDPPEAGPHRVGQRETGAQPVLDQVGEHLRVGIGPHGVAGRHQLVG
jgi:hypothetical protein